MREELTIRVATGADAPALLKIYSYYVQNTAITFEYEVPSTEEFERRIVHTLERYPYLVAEDQGQIVGQGNHETLLKDCEVYQQIYISQSGGEKFEDETQ